MQEFFYWKFHYLYSVISIFITLILFAHLLRQRRSSTSTIAWLLILFFVPFLGAFLYLLLGVRKIRKAEAISLYKTQTSCAWPAVPSVEGDVEKLLSATAAFPKCGGNSCQLLPSGEESYRALVQMIEQAKEQIEITTFILGWDEVGKTILKKLADRAQAGVKVRLLLDGFGSLWLYPWRLRSFRRQGVRIAFFLPLLRHKPFQGYANLRNHRKLAIADGRVALLGGMNLAKEYMGPSPDSGRWVDLSVQVSGEVVVHLSDVFRADWEFATGEKRPFAPDLANSGEPLPEQRMQVVPSGPDLVGDSLYDALVVALFSAEKRIWIATPYFVPDETLAKSIETASRRGVDVRILLPEKSNHRLADLARVSYLRQIEHAGGQVYFLPEKMMHAKVLLVDNAYTVLGSANLDLRSLLLNCELGLFIYSAESIFQVSRWFEGMQAQTRQKVLRSYFWTDLLEGAARLLAPIL